MSRLTQFFLVLIPLTIFSVAIGGYQIEPALIAAALIAYFVLLFLLKRELPLMFYDRWLIPYVLFLAAGILSILQSPYLLESVRKGTIQIVGITIMIMVSFMITRIVYSRGIELLVSPLMNILSIVAVLGLWQCLAFNIFHTNFLADYTFMNGLISKHIVWRSPDMIAGIRRVNSINGEPAHFSQYMGIVAGIMLLRLGFMGRKYTHSLSGFVPKWMAVCVIGGILVSLSIVGYGVLILTSLALVALRYRPTATHSLAMLVLGLLTLSLGWQLFASSATGEGGEGTNKLRTISTIYSAFNEGVEGSIATEAISALTLGANMTVAYTNFSENPLFGVGLGAHPVTYADRMPAWAELHPTLAEGLNADDAGSLFLRLVSETGLIGTVLYVSGWLLVVARARSAIRRAILAHQVAHTVPSRTLVTCIGVTASCIALFLAYLGRMGQYYAPSIWILLALTASVPCLLARVDAGAAKTAGSG